MEVGKLPGDAAISHSMKSCAGAWSSLQPVLCNTRPDRCDVGVCLPVLSAWHAALAPSQLCASPNFWHRGGI